MACVFVNIGSNIGDRRLNLSRAVSKIEKEFGYIELSHVVESKPQGFNSTNNFLNIGVMFHSEETPIEILNKLQIIEKSLSKIPHRHKDGSYRDREIDIDIVAIDNLVIEEERLTVPHPRLSQRLFFLHPLLELAPSWRHPATGLDCTEMIIALEQSDADK